MDNPVDGDGGHRSPGYRPTLLDSQSLVSSLFRQASERLRERGGAAQTDSRQDAAVDQWTKMRRRRLTLGTDRRFVQDFLVCGCSGGLTRGLPRDVSGVSASTSLMD